MVGEEGIEPSPLARHDFESCASTNSATRPSFALKLTFLASQTKKYQFPACAGRRHPGLCHIVNEVYSKSTALAILHRSGQCYNRGN